jgi:Uncharacterised protein family (UPF0236)
MTTKLKEIFGVYENEFEILSKSISESGTSYGFETKFNKLLKEFGQSMFQGMIGKVPKSKNEQTTILTSMGNICFPKNHSFAAAPGGFKISPYMQEQLCRVGTKMVFEEASEEIVLLMGLEVNAKQIERLCHHYGGLLGDIDWQQAYNDSVQLRLPLNHVTYVMMDGSMLLTRQKGESWKEVKLCRTFQSGDRAENISKGRNYIGQSNYVAHLGNHHEFLDKVLDILPCQTPLVFIGDGAKWIWNWVDEYYPKSIQILDFYHCKEHLFAFAKKYHPKDEDLARKWVDACIDKLLAKKADELLAAIEQLPCNHKELEKEKGKLYNYLQNNQKRINYGLYKEQGLLFGSGAIESANRDIIQKRMKLSGQRWTLSGAQQMLNLRVCFKSGQSKILNQLMVGYLNAA